MVLDCSVMEQGKQEDERVKVDTAVLLEQSQPRRRRRKQKVRPYRQADLDKEEWETLKALAAMAGMPASWYFGLVGRNYLKYRWPLSIIPKKGIDKGK